MSADAAAVSGLQRYTWSSGVPERPGKFRGIVRRLIRSVAGAWPMPMQPMQPGLVDARARRDQLEEVALDVERLERLARRRVHVERDAVVGLLPVDDQRRDREVAQARVRRRADDALEDLGAGDLAHRDDVARARRQRDERLELREVDLLLDVVGRVRVGRDLDPVRLRAPRSARNRRTSSSDGNTVAVAPSSAPMLAMTWRSIAERCVEAGAGVLDDAPEAAGDVVAAEHLEDHVLRAHPVGELPDQAHPPDPRHDEVERLPRHRHRDLEPAGADREHPERPGRARVAVRAEQRLARDPEALHVHRMAHAVAGLAVPEAEALARAVQEEVVVRVAVVGLEQVVVDVLRGQLGADVVEPHRLELEHDHRPGRVLRERLVDPDPDLPPGDSLTLDEMAGDQLLRDVLAHGAPVTRLHGSVAGVT